VYLRPSVRDYIAGQAAEFSDSDDFIGADLK
jgi:hypothetical protein